MMSALRKGLGATLFAGGSAAAYKILTGVQNAKELNKDEYLKVHVWRAKRANGTITSPKNAIAKQVRYGEHAAVGHVAVESSNGIRVSYWPEHGLPPKHPGHAFHMPSHAEDKKEEGCDPDLSVKLYSLNVEDFHAAVKEVSEKTEGWAVLGPKKGNGRRAQNCSTFAYETLSAAGIGELTSECASLAKSIRTISPEDMYACILEAKEKELEKHPETKIFDSTASITPGNNR